MKRDDLVKLTSTINKESCPGSINFHCHTICSDGSMAPLELLEQAYSNKLKYLAITDHHNVNAHRLIKEKNLLRNFPKDSIILVSGIEINCLLKGCLVHVLGLGINIESKFLRPYINSESPIGNDLNIKSVSNAIRKSGGISFLAHPCRYRIPFNILIPEAHKNKIDGVEVWYDYSLNQIWKPTPFICEEVEKLTNQYGMLKSCGTDSHGYTLLGR